jgi:hypothetical protein
MHSSVHGAEFFPGEILDAAKMFLWQYERVTYRDRVLVENSDEFLVFIDNVRWSSTLNYIAKDTGQISTYPFGIEHVNLVVWAVNDFDLSIENYADEIGLVPHGNDL